MKNTKKVHVLSRPAAKKQGTTHAALDAVPPPGGGGSGGGTPTMGDIMPVVRKVRIVSRPTKKQAQSTVAALDRRAAALVVKRRSRRRAP